MKESTLTLLNELIERYPALSDIREPTARAAEAICCAYGKGGKTLVCGNGGSASDAEHIVGELMKNFVVKRKLPEDHIAMFRDSDLPDWEHLVENLERAVPAIALTGHPALATAISNDTDAAMVFAQQVYAYGKPGDVLIGLSTSGNSRNVCNALKVAGVMGLVTVGLTGSAECRFDNLCDILIKAPERETLKVQEYHLPIYHAICLMVEHELFAPG